MNGDELHQQHSVIATGDARTIKSTWAMRFLYGAHIHKQFPEGLSSSRLECKP